MVQQIAQLLTHCRIDQMIFRLTKMMNYRWKNEIQRSHRLVKHVLHTLIFVHRADVNRHDINVARRQRSAPMPIHAPISPPSRTTPK